MFKILSKKNSFFNCANVVFEKDNEEQFFNIFNEIELKKYKYE